MPRLPGEHLSRFGFEREGDEQPPEFVLNK
jgi:hypothetical protein